MQRDGQGSGRARFPRVAANDNRPEARINAAVMHIARLLRPHHGGLVRQQKGNPPYRYRVAGYGGAPEQADGPEAAVEAVKAYPGKTNRLSREHRASGASDHNELAAIGKKIRAMVGVIKDGSHDGPPGRVERATRRHPDIHLKTTDIYRRKVGRLAAALANPRGRDEAAEAIRGLIERIVLTSSVKRGELHGGLGTILEWAGARNRKGANDTPKRECRSRW